MKGAVAFVYEMWLASKFKGGADESMNIARCDMEFVDTSVQLCAQLICLVTKASFS